MNIVAHVFGLGAMLSAFLIYQQKTRKRIMLAKLSADACWAVHYLLLGAIAGMLPNVVGIFRELVFINRQDKTWANKCIWPILFISINLALGMTTFHSIYNILPIVASTFVTSSLWINNPALTKLITIPVCLAFMVYDFCVESYIGMVNESISIMSIVIFFIRERNESHE